MLPDKSAEYAYFKPQNRPAAKRQGKTVSFVLSEKATENLRRAANRACKSQSELLRGLLEALD